MLNFRHATPAVLAAAFGIAAAAPATAQEFAPHRAVYSVTTMDKGKPSGDAPGTYAFDLAASARGMRLNRFLIGLGHADKRAAYKADAEAACKKLKAKQTDCLVLKADSSVAQTLQ